MNYAARRLALASSSSFDLLSQSNEHDLNPSKETSLKSTPGVQQTPLVSDQYGSKFSLSIRFGQSLVCRTK